MSDMITQMFADTLAMPGLAMVLALTLVAALVYGFAGFGAGLVYFPMVTALVPAPVAIAAFAVSALASLFTIVPRALPEIDRKSTLIMLAAALSTMSAGIFVLRVGDPVALRWGTSALVALTLCALMAGWRYRAQPSALTRAAVGAATGIVGGATGLTGPIVVMFHLGGSGNARSNRASTLVFLTCLSLCSLPLYALQGLLRPEAIGLGLLQLIPYALGTRIGQALFNPSLERLYRRVAYGLIAVSLLIGLPKP